MPAAKATEGDLGIHPARQLGGSCKAATHDQGTPEEEEEGQGRRDEGSWVQQTDQEKGEASHNSIVIFVHFYLTDGPLFFVIFMVTKTITW